MRLPRLTRRKDINRGPKKELERSNAVDVELGLLKCNERTGRWQRANPYCRQIDVLVIGDGDVSPDFIHSLRGAQLKKMGATEQMGAGSPLKNTAGQDAVSERDAANLQLETTTEADVRSDSMAADLDHGDALVDSFMQRRLEAQEAFSDLVEECWSLTDPSATDKALPNDVDCIAHS